MVVRFGIERTHVSVSRRKSTGDTHDPLSRGKAAERRLAIDDWRFAGHYNGLSERAHTHRDGDLFGPPSRQGEAATERAESSEGALYLILAGPQPDKCEFSTLVGHGAARVGPGERDGHARKRDALHVGHDAVDDTVFALSREKRNQEQRDDERSPHACTHGFTSETGVSSDRNRRRRATRARGGERKGKARASRSTDVGIDYDPYSAWR